jgi:hypothetical protein
MQSRVVYIMIAGLAVCMLSTLSSRAIAGDKCYFRVLSPEAAMPTRLDNRSRTIETVTSYPAVIERTSTNFALIEGTNLMPMLLEKTTAAKPHHLPFSFGVWP